MVVKVGQLKSADQNRINAFETKAFRQLLRISSNERKTNERILQKVNADPHLLAEMKKRKLWTCNAEKRKLLGKRDNTRHDPRRTKTWKTKNMLERQHQEVDRVRGRLLLRSAEDRKLLRRIVHEAANPRSEDG